MGESRINVHRDQSGVSRVPVNQGGPTTTVIAAAVSGKRHRVSNMLLTLSADGTIKFAGSSSGDLTGPMDIIAKGGFSVGDMEDLVVTAPSEDLQLITTGGAARGVIKVTTEA